MNWWEYWYLLVDVFPLNWAMWRGENHIYSHRWKWPETSLREAIFPTPKMPGNDTSFKIEKWYFDVTKECLRRRNIADLNEERKGSRNIAVKLDWISLLEFCDDWISARRDLKRWFHFKLQALWIMHSLFHVKRKQEKGGQVDIPCLLRRVMRRMKRLCHGISYQDWSVIRIPLEAFMVLESSKNLFSRAIIVFQHLFAPIISMLINFGFKWPNVFVFCRRPWS